MTEWRVEVVTVRNVEKHPNADSLSVADANGFPVIFRTGDYAEGTKAVHVPIDSIVPEGDPRWEFLVGHRRIKAKKLRGVFSMGLLTPANEEWEVGQIVDTELGITKHDPDLLREMGGGGLRVPPPNAGNPPLPVPKYDIEGLRRYPHVLVEGEEVWISEKIHGQNARFLHDGETFWAGSRSWFKLDVEGDTWWTAARRYQFETSLSLFPGIAIYGETYGNNSDMAYGVNRAKESDRFAMFDALDTNTGRWFDVDEMLALAEALGVPPVPTLYRGPWYPHLAWELAEGVTLLGNGAHVREGVVVKPVRERQDRGLGRVFLKAVGQGYLLRKAA